MIEKIKEACHKNEVCAAALTDLTNASECLKHDLLVAKLHTFGFFTNLLESCLICDALHNFEPCAQFTKREKHPSRSVTFTFAG